MRSYDVAVREQLGEPVEFELAHRGPDGERVSTVFTCKGELSSLMLSEIARHADLEVATAAAMAIIADFFVEVFDDDAQYRRFQKYCREHRVKDEVLLQVMGDLVEDLTGRPTVQPSSSASTQSPTGRTSRAAGFMVIEGTTDLERRFSA